MLGKFLHNAETLLQSLLLYSIKCSMHCKTLLVEKRIITHY